MNRARRESKLFTSGIDWGLLAASIAGPLTLYMSTMPRIVVLEDDGLFLMAGAYLGVAHPPGYPLHTFIVYLFTLLPFGSVAFLGHLSSAVIGALACGCLYLCVRCLDVTPIPALTASWLFAASEHFWSQAIITEVYTLNAFFFFGLYMLVLLGLRRPHKKWIWVVCAGIYGLSLANHWPLMLLSTPGLMVLAYPAWRVVSRILPSVLGTLAVCTAAPYAWMVWRSQQHAPMNFYGSIDSLNELWFYVSREGYAAADSSPSAGWYDRLQFMQWLGTEMVWQLTILGFALALVGVVVLLRRRRYAVLISGLLVILGHSIVLIALINYDFDDFRIAVFRPYSLLCYGVLAVWFGIGFQFLLSKFLDIRSRNATYKTRLNVSVATALGIALVAWSVHGNWKVNDRSETDFAERYVNLVFDFLPEDSVLFVTKDEAIPIGYYKYVENRRPDVDLYELSALIYNKRLYDPFLPVEDKEEVLRKYISSNRRAVYTVGDVDAIEISRGGYYGFLREVIRGAGTDMIELNAHNEGEEYFTHLALLNPIDRWERQVRNSLMFRYGKYLGVVLYSENSIYLDSMTNLFELAEDSYTCLLGMATSMLQYGNESHWDSVSRWLALAEGLKDQSTSKAMLARLYYLRGFLAQSQGKHRYAIEQLKISRYIYSHPNNGAVELLSQYQSNSVED